MNIDNGVLRAIRTQGVAAYVKYLRKEESRLSMYEALARDQLGQFLEEEWKLRLETIRQLYVAIDPSHPQAMTALATLQATEREVVDWMQRITEVSRVKDSISTTIHAVEELMMERSRKEEDTSFIPSSAPKRESRHGRVDRRTGE